MPNRSAGILLYRHTASGPEVLLVHPGGPFWMKKDEGAWSIPKGLVDPGEDDLAAAKREFEEETGSKPSGDAVPLGEFRYQSGKIVVGFALRGDFDLSGFRSSTFLLEWPPKSGRMTEFPEADRAGWFGLEEAERLIVKGQRAMLSALASLLTGEKG
jgi:predicted NUDIX family NTP pyrophosphohydrolase